jgi:hypothetical protein
MARARSRPLKVFQAQFGFYDTVVAAPSQAAALRAWGVHQNLFADGQAKITVDSKAVEAALAHPETPLRRAVGSRDAFSLDPVGLPKVPQAPGKTAIAAKTAATAKPARPPADRSKLDAAERAVRKIDDDRRRAEADLRRRQDALDAKVAAAQRDYVAARKAADAIVANARQAWREAGGED